MPLIDLSLVISSPMFSDTFDVRRRTAVIGQNGRGAHSDNLMPGQRGVVTAETNGTDRNKDFATGGKVISVITMFRLRDQVTCSLPDIVIWHGDEYICLKLEDATNYGSGFVEATCECQDLQEAKPQGASVAAGPIPVSGNVSTRPFGVMPSGVIDGDNCIFTLLDVNDNPIIPVGAIVVIVDGSTLTPVKDYSIATGTNVLIYVVAPSEGAGLYVTGQA